jgi:hypothetical protein
LAVAAIGGYLVAAVKDKNSGELKVIYWQASAAPSLSINWLDALTVPGQGQIDQLAICAYQQAGGSWKAVTASTDGNKSLSVTVWDGVWESGSSFKVKQLGRNTNATANKATTVAIASWGGGVVTAVREPGTDKLKLIAWEITPNFEVLQKGTKTDPDPTATIDELKMVQVRTPSAPYDTVATAARHLDKSLEVITWDVGDGGSTIKLLGRAQPPAPAFMQTFSIASPPAYDLQLTGGGEASFRGQIITAGIRHIDPGALRVTAWLLESGGGLQRILDVDLPAEKHVALDYLFTGTHQGDFGTFPMYEVSMGVRMPDGKLGFMVGALYDDGVVTG